MKKLFAIILLAFNFGTASAAEVCVAYFGSIQGENKEYVYLLNCTSDTDQSALLATEKYGRIPADRPEENAGIYYLRLVKKMTEAGYELKGISSDRFDLHSYTFVKP